DRIQLVRDVPDTALAVLEFDIVRFAPGSSPFAMRAIVVPPGMIAHLFDNFAGAIYRQSLMHQFKARRVQRGLFEFVGFEVPEVRYDDHNLLHKSSLPSSTKSPITGRNQAGVGEFRIADVTAHN